MADITEKTIVEELKQAVTTLRCDHRFPCQPPHGTVWAPGPCLLCGIPCPDDDEEIPDALREPLASWLERYAKWADDSIFDYEGGDGPVHEAEYCDGEIGKNCRCFAHPLAVARVLNGGAS